MAVMLDRARSTQRTEAPKPSPPPPPAPKAVRTPVKDSFVGARTDYAALSGGSTVPAHQANQQRLFAGLEPQWLQRGTRPPFISEETWRRQPISERNAILADCRQGLQDHLNEMAPPQWVVDGTRPPHVSEGTWKSIGIQERNALVEDARTAWRAAMQEDIGFYFNGVPEGGVRVQNPFQATGPGMWGQGTKGELASAAVQEGRPSQYINPRELLGNDNYVSAHYNLCGQLSVGSMLGLTPSQALKLYADTGYDGLATGGTTGFGELESMIEQQEGWSAETKKGSASGPPMTAKEMDAALRSGQGIIALVNIDTTGDSGMLTSVENGQKDVAHWVRVTDVTTNPNGETYVRVYNPFQNSEEVYTWEEFNASWASTSGNSTQYGMILATPPTEPAAP